MTTRSRTRATSQTGTARSGSARTARAGLPGRTYGRAARRATTSARDGQGLRGGTAPVSGKALTDDGYARHLIRFFTAHPQFAARISDQVDKSTGAPRQLSVTTMLILMLVAAADGRMLLADVHRLANSLHPSLRRDLGLVRTVHGQRHEISVRQVGYLFARIADALRDRFPTNAHVDDATGTIVDADTGEILEWHHAITVEELGNDLVDAIWDWFKLRKPTTAAIDSYPIATHLAVKSMGGNDYVDTDALTQQCPATATATDIGHKLRIFHHSWAGGRTPAEIDALAKPGPVVPTKNAPRTAPGFPWADRFGRLHHNLDAGAGDTYRGGGTVRTGGPEYGRDHHTIVATGTLPNGEPYPAFTLGYGTRLGNMHGAATGRDLTLDAVRRGTPLDTVIVDRGYTKTVDFKHAMLHAGITTVSDLTADQRRADIIQPGILVLDGAIFSTGIPTPLTDLPGHQVGATYDEKTALAARYDERIPFAARPMGRFDAQGRMRMRMPANAQLKTTPGKKRPRLVGYTARCVNAKHFTLMDRSVPLTTCRKGQPCACDATITIYRDQLPASWEPALYGTSNWLTAKGPRSSVESYNALAQHHRRLDRHSIRVHHRSWNLADLALRVSLLFTHIFTWVKELGYVPDDNPDADPLDPTALESPRVQWRAGSPGSGCCWELF